MRIKVLQFMASAIIALLIANTINLVFPPFPDFVGISAGIAIAILTFESVADWVDKNAPR